MSDGQLLFTSLQCSTKLMQLNYSDLNEIKTSLSFWSRFFVPMLLDDKISLP